MIQGYSIYRKDRNTFGGGVAFYIQNQIPVKIRKDLMPTEIEALWLQIYMPHLRLILIGSFTRPPNTNKEYLDQMCDMLVHGCNSSLEIYFMGDFNIDLEFVYLSNEKKN